MDLPQGRLSILPIFPHLNSNFFLFFDKNDILFLFFDKPSFSGKHQGRKQRNFPFSLRDFFLHFPLLYTKVKTSKKT